MMNNFREKFMYQLMVILLESLEKEDVSESLP